MSDIGQAVAHAIAGIIILGFLAGGVVFLGGYFLISWLAAHLTLGWL
jgi:hypothetical protein